MEVKNRVPLTGRIIVNRKELSQLTGCDVSIIDRWIHEGMPCFRDGRMMMFERSSAIEWLRNKALHREGMTRKVIVYDNDIFPGIELA